MQDSDFDAAWREFADDDARVKAPIRVRHAVMQAWDTAQQNSAQTRRRLNTWLAVTAVASVAVTIVAVVVWHEPSRRGLHETTVSVARVQEAVFDPTSGPLVRLIADPAFENEPLEIVRLRLPRTSLEAIGITLVEPEASSLVDVDVVVGSDGLPRAIQRVRLVVDRNFQ
jgi:hypothetical protein